MNVLQTKKLNVSEQQLCDALEGRKLKEVVRSGKLLHFNFDDKQTLAIHLMLHGKLHWFTEVNEQKFTILEFLFEDETGLALTDFQRQATPTLNPEVTEVPDALDKGVNFKFWKDTLTRKHSAVKTILMDQHVVRGIGNAYADEILYHARLSPFSVANKIPDDFVKALAKSVKTVLLDAGEQIAELAPDIISGEVRDFLKVHQSKLTETASGAAIQQKPLSSRKTYFTNEQQLFI